MSESKKNIAHGIEIPQKKLFFFVIFSGISISVAKVFVYWANILLLFLNW